MSFRKSVKKIIPNSDLLRIVSYAPLIRTFDFKNSVFFSGRELLYAHIHQTYINNTAKPLTYLEFGVFEGASLKEWLTLDTNKQSRFYGFDTFTGLPESWKFADGVLAAGHFSTGGESPRLNDNRVSFVKGLFQDTLDNFLESTPLLKDSVLVIHNDSDLYTSTHFCLATLNKHIKKGTIIIFDEFSSPMEEMRAFIDYTSSFRRTYKIVAHTKGYEQVAVEIL